MKDLIKDKQISTLAFQITVVSVTLMAASFLTETQIWYDYFNFKVDLGKCNWGNCTSRHKSYTEHYHWNYRGWIYLLTGVAYFVLSVIRIVKTHYVSPEEKKRQEQNDFSVRESLVKRIMHIEEKDHYWDDRVQAELLKLRDQLIELDKESNK